MRGREIFGRYRQLVEELSNERASDDAWFEVLQAIVRRLDHDSAELAGTGARLLYDELCDQFEQEAYLTDNERRRKVLMAATKLLEMQRRNASPGINR
jgi:hypothetical protein